MVGWGGWQDRGGGDSFKEKVSVRDDGSTKFERLDSIGGNKHSHQHTWTTRDSSGKLKGGGATPNRGNRGSSGGSGK